MYDNLIIKELTQREKDSVALVASLIQERGGIVVENKTSGKMECLCKIPMPDTYIIHPLYFLKMFILETIDKIGDLITRIEEAKGKIDGNIWEYYSKVRDLEKVIYPEGVKRRFNKRKVYYDN